MRVSSPLTSDLGTFLTGSSSTIILHCWHIRLTARSSPPSSSSTHRDVLCSATHFLPSFWSLIEQVLSHCRSRAATRPTLIFRSLSSHHQFPYHARTSHGHCIDHRQRPGVSHLHIHHSDKALSLPRKPGLDFDLQHPRNTLPTHFRNIDNHSPPQPCFYPRQSRWLSSHSSPRHSHRHSHHATP